MTTFFSGAQNKSICTQKIASTAPRPILTRFEPFLSRFGPVWPEIWVWVCARVRLGSRKVVWQKPPEPFCIARQTRHVPSPESSVWVFGCRVHAGPKPAPSFCASEDAGQAARPSAIEAANEEASLATGGARKKCLSWGVIQTVHLSVSYGREARGGAHLVVVMATLLGRPADVLLDVHPVALRRQTLNPSRLCNRRWGPPRWGAPRKLWEIGRRGREWYGVGGGSTCR